MGQLSRVVEKHSNNSDKNGSDAWEILACEEVGSWLPWFKVYQDHVRLPNGVEISDFMRIDMINYVQIFAVTKDHHVGVVEQYRHGPGMMTIELPAGAMDSDDDDEAPLETAKRELMEETGMVAANWRFLGKYYIDSNRGCGWMYAYLATDAEQVQDAQPEATEWLHPQFLPLAKVRQLWLDGTINSIGSTATIGLAFAHLDQIDS
jgi:8-oxo-dGTP pyrophosphatase MutT (NUDIX family)